jgi:feruloyl-CoA synthase
VFAAEGLPFANALKYAADQGAEILLCSEPVKDLKSTEFKKISKSWRKGAAKKARANVTPETTAKVHFSGTTSEDMTAIATAQVTMCANQEALAEIIPALSARAPVVVDDAPWHRTGSGNLVLNAVLRNGGTLYIDRFGQEENSAGKGDNLVSPSPSIHITELMPLFELITRLEEDVLLRKAFFRNLDLIWIVSGIITEEARNLLQKLALEQTNAEIPILASFTGSGTSAVNTAL